MFIVKNMLNVRYEYITIVDISMRTFARYSHIFNNIETYDICLKYSSKPEKNTIEMKARMTGGVFFQQPLATIFHGGAGPVEQKDGFKQIIRMMIFQKAEWIWVCLKMGYIPNYSHLIGIMIINHWV